MNQLIHKLRSLFVKSHKDQRYPSVVKLDATDLPCPMPIVQAKQRLRNMLPGQILHLLTSDPSSVIDVAAFTATVGYTLLESTAEQGCYSFLIQK